MLNDSKRRTELHNGAGCLRVQRQNRLQRRHFGANTNDQHVDTDNDVFRDNDVQCVHNDCEQFESDKRNDDERDINININLNINDNFTVTITSVTVAIDAYAATIVNDHTIDSSVRVRSC